MYEWTVIYNNENFSGSWNLKGSDIDGEVAGDESGKSVSLSSDGTILAIGANFYDGDSSNSSDDRGHVRIYKYVSNDWKKVGISIDGKADSTPVGGQSGSSVSLSSDGTLVAIGSPFYNVFRGHVRIFEIDEIVAVNEVEEATDETSAQYTVGGIGVESDIQNVKDTSNKMENSSPIATQDFRRLISQIKIDRKKKRTKDDCLLM